jgi:methionine salvage enolase-phosphatase E1
MQIVSQLPDALVEEVKQYISLENQSEALVKIIQDWVRYKKIQELKQLRGKIHFEGDLTKLRDMDKQNGFD